ncbi:hypothetical protein KAX17_18230, partial [Candidatus Bipolaricaulota bacterium]|nr:hypothetical protein [Candidatus Bipolaricaulota bacterium]
FGKAIGFTQINELGTIETPNSVDQHANATSERFAPIENTCELIATAPAAAEAPPTETTPEVTTTEEPETPEPGIPEEILACTEELGKASGTDYKNSGFRRYRVSQAKRISFFKDEIDAYLKCSKLGSCARTLTGRLGAAKRASRDILLGVSEGQPVGNRRLRSVSGRAILRLLVSQVTARLEPIVMFLWGYLASRVGRDKSNSVRNPCTKPPLNAGWEWWTAFELFTTWMLHQPRSCLNKLDA